MARRAPRTHRALGAALLALGLLAPLGAPARADSPQSGADASSSSDSRPALFASSTSADGLSVSIDALTPRILTDEGELVVSGTVTNTTERTLTTPAILLAMGQTTPISVAELAAALDGENSPGTTVSATNLGEDLDAGATAKFEFRVPVDQLPLGSSTNWGPRTVAVGAFSDGASGHDRSIVLWDSGAAVAPTRVSALVPWTSQNSTGDDAERLAVSAIATMKGATLAMDAAVLPTPVEADATAADAEAAQSAADEENAASAAFVANLLTRTGEVVALPTGDADLGALALSGSRSLLSRAESSITAFPSSPAAAGWGPDGALDEADSAGQSATAVSRAQSAAASDADSAQSGAAPAATTSVLTDVAWPSEATFGTTELAAFSDRVTIAPASALQPDAELGFTSLAVAEVDTSTGETSSSGATDSTATALVQNEQIAQLLDWSTSSAADELDAEQGLAAISAIITRERPNASRTVFAATSRTASPTPGLASRLEALLTSRWVEPTAFSVLASSEPTDVERAQVGAGQLAGDTDEAVSTLSDALGALVPLATATSAPDEVEASVADALLPSVSAAVSPNEQRTRASQFSARVSALRAKVSAEPSEAVNLINKSADFPVRVRNDLPWDVDAVVTLVPSDPRLEVTKPTTATLKAGAVTSVKVPVSAIGSGDIEVVYKVSTPDGSVLAESRAVLVRMRAGWEDAITIGAAAVFGLLFVGGLVRTIRSRLRRGRMADGE